MSDVTRSLKVRQDMSHRFVFKVHAPEYGEAYEEIHVQQNKATRYFLAPWRIRSQKVFSPRPCASDLQADAIPT